MTLKLSIEEREKLEKAFHFIGMSEAAAKSQMKQICGDDIDANIEPTGDFDTALSYIKTARNLLDQAEAELMLLAEQGE